MVALILPGACFGEFFVATEGNYTPPAAGAANLVDFEANLRMSPHRPDLVTNQGEAIDVAVIVNEADWHDVRHPVSYASEAPDPARGQVHPAFLGGHLTDDHGTPLVKERASLCASRCRGSGLLASTGYAIARGGCYTRCSMRHAGKDGEGCADASCAGLKHLLVQPAVSRNRSAKSARAFQSVNS